MPSGTERSDLGYAPDYTIASGATLRDTLTSLGMTQSDLATRTGFSLKHVNQIIHGSAPITHETALILEKVTGVPARVWNRIEANYRDRLARIEDRDALASDSQWLQSLPIKELTRRGVLTKGADPGTLLQELCRFFGVANRQSWENVWRAPLASFRRSKTFESDPGALAAWLRFGELAAADIECAPFDARAFKAALQQIRTLTTKDVTEFVPLMVEYSAAAGVAVVFVPEVTGARASGAARWLSPTKASIQLSLRHKSDDHLWFSFFHEAGHLLLHSKKEMFITEGPSHEAVEEEADSYSRTMLIPKQYESRLRELHSNERIQTFAAEIGIAPGIVVGRLQKEGILDWGSSSNRLKRRFKFVEK